MKLDQDLKLANFATDNNSDLLQNLLQTTEMIPQNRNTSARICNHRDTREKQQQNWASTACQTSIFLHLEGLCWLKPQQCVAVLWEKELKLMLIRHDIMDVQ